MLVNKTDSRTEFHVQHIKQGIVSDRAVSQAETIF